MFRGKKDKSEVCKFLDEIKKSLLTFNLIWHEFLHLYFSVIHRPFSVLDQRLANFSCTGSIVNILGLLLQLQLTLEQYRGQGRKPCMVENM